MKVMWMFIFFVLPILGLIYTVWHIWQLVPFTTPWRCSIVVVILLLFLSMFLLFSGAIEKMPLSIATPAYEVSTSVVFLLLYIVMLFLVLDVGRLIHIVPKSWLHHNMYTTSGIAIFMLSIFVYGNIHYYNKAREAININTSKLTTLNKKTTKIVMLSDLHLGYHNRKAEFRRWVDMINAENPDLILIAGDIIDVSVRPLIQEQVAKEFHLLNAPVYACLGNHEYYSGSAAAQKFYEQAGIHLLRDSVARLGDISVIGRDDRTNPQRKSLAKILSLGGVDSQRSFTIVLDHQPYHLEEAEIYNIDFQFSGHTHHGQVWPISWITDAIYEDAFGYLRKGHTQYYVSSGMGIWGGKFRIGTRSEYVVLTINAI